MDSVFDTVIINILLFCIGCIGIIRIPCHQKVVLKNSIFRVLDRDKSKSEKNF